MGRHWAEAALCVSAFWCSCAMAHHSGAMFDLDTQIELRGTVVDFKLRSPHASFVIDAQAFDEDGKPLTDSRETWEVEWESAPMLKTLDIEPDTFARDDDITILVFPHRDRSFHFAKALRVEDAFGAVHIMADSNRKFAPSVQRAAADVTDKEEEDVPSSSQGSTGLAGRWQQPLLTFPDDSPKYRLNAAGAAALRNFDHSASPANTCEPMNVPGVFFAPFFLFEIRLDEERAVLHNEAYSVTRTVPLGRPPTAVDAEGFFGTATARLVDGVLTVTSRGFRPSRWGLGHDEALGGADLPSSEQKTLTERFEVTENGRTLLYTYEVFDPAYMAEAYKGQIELTRVPEGTPLYAYDCDPESAKMWSRTRTDEPLRIGE